ncbi:hypothetical protein [Zunongwangia endophytica]|uniref:Uncharacterized protein n=1 Tax=Zunongwangia endophytica TaxID=1808945 RepID=A0ABV8H5A1_9FLAO|nr:hypothetical protein [Zunongwangia endophytica]MDN3595497.1 hypothetical protein [Zunongwangia endophytica]
MRFYILAETKNKNVKGQKGEPAEALYFHLRNTTILSEEIYDCSLKLHHADLQYIYQ